MNDTRQQELIQWIETHLGQHSINLIPLKNDASLRKFYRLNTAPTTILMDAAADFKNQEFLHVANLLKFHELRAPKIYSHNMDLGLFHMEDFGDNLLFNYINKPLIENFLKQAVDIIVQIQKISASELINPSSLDAAFIDKELNLFNEWFVNKYLELKLTTEQQQIIDEAFVFIKNILLSQPYLCMHRDFHSENLMILADGSIGIIDFQDLMFGPVTYDLISLLKDRYVTCSEESMKNFLIYYYQIMGENLTFKNFSEFVFYFDIVGLQRHLKIIGGFSKIYLTRNNGHYLQYFDRILDYIVQVTAKYSQFDQFYRLLTLTIIRKLL